MEKVSHELLLDGTIQPGFSLATAVDELTRLFKDKTEWFQPLLNGEPVSRKLRITPENAEKLRAFIAGLGLQGQILPEAPSPTDGPVDLVAMAGMNDVTTTPSPENPAAPAHRQTHAESPVVNEPLPDSALSSLKLVPIEDSAAEKAAPAAPTPGLICPKCGVRQEPSEQCSACGIFFAKYQAQQDTTTTGGSAEATVTRSNASQDVPALEAQMLDYVRENGYYYDSKFDAIHKAGDGFKPGWHWPAFFVPFHWALYRKLWLWAVAMFVAPALLNAILPLLGILIANGLFAISANFIYYKHVRNAVLSLRKRRQDTPENLAKAGGTSWPAVAVGIVLPIVFSGVLMSWMMPGGFKGLRDFHSAYDAQDPKVMKTRQGQETFLNMSMAKLAVAVTIKQGKLKPAEVSYERLVDEGVPANKLVDGWGTPFRIGAQGTEVTVTSAGPDKTFDTGDDLEQ
jgi:hypothetical protein